MSISKQAIYNALAGVNDPISSKSILELDMLKKIEVDDLQVNIQIEITPAHSKVHEVDLKQNVIEQLHKSVSENLIFNIDFIKKVVSSQQNTKPLPFAKNVIAIASGKGGVGKSTVTSNLAIALSKKGFKVGILDTDIFGPSIPTMFGVQNERPSVIKHEGKELIVPITKNDIQIMSIGFFTSDDQAVVWRGAMASKALKQFIFDCDWDELDYLLLDLPPGTSDVHLTLVQTIPITGAFVVTTPQKVAVADARKAVSMFMQEQIGVPVLGIIENMSYFIPAELPDNKYFIFGEGGGSFLAEHFSVPLTGKIPLVQSVREAGDLGTPEATKEKSIIFDIFLELASKVIDQVDRRNAVIPPTKIVEVNR